MCVSTDVICVYCAMTTLLEYGSSWHYRLPNIAIQLDKYLGGALTERGLFSELLCCEHPEVEMQVCASNI